MLTKRNENAVAGSNKSPKEKNGNKRGKCAFVSGLSPADHTNGLKIVDGLKIIAANNI